MANVNNPHGLLPLHVNMAGGFLQIQRFVKLVGYATGIFMNDPVARVSGGALQALTTPGTTLFSGVSLEYSPASTANAGIAVVISPDAIYECQDSGAGVLAAADMGLNANVLAGAGSTLTRQSGYTIDDTTKAVTNTLDLHLLQLWASPDNAFGQYSRIEVMINKHRMTPQAVGV